MEAIRFRGVRINLGPETRYEGLFFPKCGVAFVKEGHYDPELNHDYLWSFKFWNENDTSEEFRQALSAELNPNYTFSIDGVCGERFVPTAALDVPDSHYLSLCDNYVALLQNNAARDKKEAESRQQTALVLAAFAKNRQKIESDITALL